MSEDIPDAPQFFKEFEHIGLQQDEHSERDQISTPQPDSEIEDDEFQQDHQQSCGRPNHQCPAPSFPVLGFSHQQD